MQAIHSWIVQSVFIFGSVSRIVSGETDTNCKGSYSAPKVCNELQPCEFVAHYRKVGINSVYMNVTRLDMQQNSWSAVGFSVQSSASMGELDVVYASKGDKGWGVSDRYTRSRSTPLMDVAREGTNDLTHRKVTFENGILTYSFVKTYNNDGFDVDFESASCVTIVYVVDGGLNDRMHSSIPVSSPTPVCFNKCILPETTTAASMRSSTPDQSSILPPATDKPMDLFPTTYKPMDLLSATNKPIDLPPSSNKPRDPPPTTNNLMGLPRSTDKPMDLPAPSDKPRDLSPTTDKPLDLPGSTDKPMDLPAPSDKPRDLSPTTDKPLDLPGSTDKPMDLPAPSDKPRDLSPTTDKPLDLPGSTDKPMDLPAPSDKPRNLPPATDEPLDLPGSTDKPMDLPAPLEKPRNLPPATDEPTGLPSSTDKPMNESSNAEQQSNEPTNTEQASNKPTATDLPVEKDQSGPANPTPSTIASPVETISKSEGSNSECQLSYRNDCFSKSDAEVNGSSVEMACMGKGKLAEILSMSMANRLAGYFGEGCFVDAERSVGDKWQTMSQKRPMDNAITPWKGKAPPSDLTQTRAKLGLMGLEGVGDSEHTYAICMKRKLRGKFQGSASFHDKRMENFILAQYSDMKATDCLDMCHGDTGCDSFYAKDEAGVGECRLYSTSPDNEAAILTDSPGYAIYSVRE